LRHFGKESVRTAAAAPVVPLSAVLPVLLAWWLAAIRRS